MGSSFEDLQVWKKSCRLAVRLYRLLSDCKDFGIKDQIQRSCVSIPSNIAEGQERNSTADFIRFLNIAKGSAAELRTQLYIAKETGILSDSHAAEAITEAKELSRMIHALISSLK